MILISYDISNDKLRTKFSKYLEKYGHRIQYSLFQIDNSPRVLNNIIVEVKNRFEKKFGEDDSIYILELSSSCKITKFGYARHEDTDVHIIS